MEHLHKKKEADSKKERTQMIDWLVTYYQGAEEFEALMDQVDAENEENEKNEGE